MRVQELKSSGGVLYSVQTTLPEAGGQVGVEPAAVSREWPPGAPCSLPARAEHENSCCDRLGTALLGVYLPPRAKALWRILIDNICHGNEQGFTHGDIHR